MKIIELIENIRKEHIYISNERDKILKLNIEINNEIDSLMRSTWIIRKQQYYLDFLNSVPNALSVIKKVNNTGESFFVEGHREFVDSFHISSMFQHLRNNPKLVAYMLYFAEKNHHRKLASYLTDTFVSTIYSHCYLDEDKVAVLDILDELMDIYSNFYEDVRKQIHSSYSSFRILYNHLCNESPDMKTFFKLVLYKPIMHVLAENTLYLDIDINRALHRFDARDREKHFGKENTSEFQENVSKYKKWILKMLQHFVANFVSSLRNNIFAFPRSLALLIIRIYTQLIQKLDFSQVYAICIDLIFYYVICPAIHHPDMYGLTELHINKIARFNLAQCATLIQTLALTKYEDLGPHLTEVYDLFDKDCLSFVIDHILGIFNNISLPPPIKSKCLPYFLISAEELKIFLQYIQSFLDNEDIAGDDPLKVHFDKLSMETIKFCLDLHVSRPVIDQRRMKINFQVVNVDLQQFFEIQEKDAYSVQDIESCYEVDGASSPVDQTQVYQFDNNDYNHKMIGMLSDKRFLSKMNEDHIEFSENLNAILNEVDEIFKKEINDDEAGSDNLETVPPFDFHAFLNKKGEFLRKESKEYPDDVSLVEPVKDNLSFFGTDTSDLLNYVTIGKFNFESFKTAEAIQPLVEIDDFDSMMLEAQITDTKNSAVAKELLIELDDIPRPFQATTSKSTEQLAVEKPKLLQTMSADTRPLTNRKRFLSLGNLKTIKDKVKLSLKDKVDFTPQKVAFNPVVDDCIQEPLVDINPDVPEKPDLRSFTEILNQYRMSKDVAISLDDNLNIGLDSETSGSSKSQSTDSTKNIKEKLRKLMRSINLSLVYQSYHFLNLASKNYFIMFLKILLSQSLNTDQYSNSVLIMDIMRTMENIDDVQFEKIFKEMDVDMKMRNFFTIYLIKCQQYLLQMFQQIKSTQSLLQKDQFVMNYNLATQLVGKKCELKEADWSRLIEKFSEPTMLGDEKAALVDSMIEDIVKDLERVPMCEQQRWLAERAVQSYLMSHLYETAFHPNGEIDKMRDRILYQQIAKLSKSITHTSKLLKIPVKHHVTSPWPSAQDELHLLYACRSPEDKVRCIHRCCTHIITLLSTSEHTEANADDLLPVLIFVVIKANPMSILSTIQYVNTFYSKKMSGEDAYYWTQFSSAIQSIKKILQELPC